MRVKNRLYLSSSFCQEFSVIDSSSISFQLKYLSEVELSESLIFTKLIFWAFRLYIVFIRTKSREETYNCLRISNLRDKQIVKTSFIVYNRNVRIIDNFRETRNIVLSRDSVEQSITTDEQTLVLFDCCN